MARKTNIQIGDIVKFNTEKTALGRSARKYVVFAKSAMDSNRFCLYPANSENKPMLSEGKRDGHYGFELAKVRA